MKNMFLSFIAATLVVIELLMSGCSYKSSDVLNDGQNSNVSSSEYSDISSNVTSNSDDFSKKLIDPFEGLEVQFDGIAPYCTVSFNNSKCSVEVQTYVEYSIDEKEVKTSGYFKHGEEVTVYAVLIAGGYEYDLTGKEKKYSVKDMPEYITEITDDMDFAKFQSELKDYYDSITAFKTGEYHVFETTKGYFISKSDEKEYETYFSSLKSNKYDVHSKDIPFNKIDIMFSINIKNTDDEINPPYTDDTVDFIRYFNVCAENIVKYPDGKIGWGKINPDELDFNYKVNSDSLNDLIADVVTSKKSDYNSEKISNDSMKIL